MRQEAIFSLLARPYMWFFAIMAAVCVAVFLLLGTAPIQDWDEARHGVSAYEMLQSNNFVANTYLGAFDYWNLKPPFAFYPMLAGFSLFGVTPFGLRFCSAISTVALFSILFLSGKKLGGARTGVFACTLLLGAEQFFLQHNARSGDADAFFGLLYFSAVMVLLLFWRNRLACYVAALLTGFAFLAKSFHILPLVATITVIFYMQWGRSAKAAMLFLRACAVGLLPVAMWAGLRYQHDGITFFTQMVEIDLLNRSLNKVEGHSQPPLFYVAQVAKAFWPWLVIVATAVIATFFLHWNKKPQPFWPTLVSGKEKQLLCLAIAVVLPILLFSLSQSKLRWYSYPSFPLLALGLGYTLHSALLCLKERTTLVFSLLSVFITVAVVQYSVLMTHLVRSASRTVPTHAYLAELGKKKEKHGAVLFLENGEWTQSDLLASYFYGPFHLASGGKAAYEAHDSPEKMLVPAPLPPSAQK